MTLALRLHALMRRRGIKSQSQLARLAGVSQSSIHRILLAAPGYVPTRRILMRLAQTLDTSLSWLSEGVTDLQRTERGHAARRVDGWRVGNASESGDAGESGRASESDHADSAQHHDNKRLSLQHEWHRLFTQLSHAEREALLVLARLMHQRQPAIGSHARDNRDFTELPSARLAQAEYPLPLQPYEVYPIE